MDEEFSKGSFARAALAHKAKGFSLFDREGNILENGCFTAPKGEVFYFYNGSCSQQETFCSEDNVVRGGRSS